MVAASFISTLRGHFNLEEISCFLKYVYAKYTSQLTGVSFSLSIVSAYSKENIKILAGEWN